MTEHYSRPTDPIENQQAVCKYFADSLRLKLADQKRTERLLATAHETLRQLMGEREVRNEE